MIHCASKDNGKARLKKFRAAISGLMMTIVFLYVPQTGRRDLTGKISLAASSWAAEASQSTGARWDKIVQDAKSEGKVTLLGPQTAEVRPSLVEAFRKAYPDLALEYQSGSVGDLASRVRAEIGQKKTTFDLVIGGTAVLRNKDIVDSLAGRLIVPEAADLNRWRSSDGKGLKWIDRERQIAVQTSEWVFGYIVVNSRSVNPASLRFWSDLLKPEWKGKIASHDPRGPGAGQEVASYLLDKLGGKFIVDLYKGQEVALTRSYSQVADWLAQGKYQIGIAQVPDRIEALKKEGVPLKAYSLQDAPGTLTGGFSVVSVFKGAPHTNAAAVFLNWVLSRQGQDALHRPQLYPSLRIDAPRDYVPDYTLPVAGLNYLDTYTEEFQATRVKLAKQVEEIIGR
jgi:iron(III) transport system substrate-binding protein